MLISFDPFGDLITGESIGSNLKQNFLRLSETREDEEEEGEEGKAQDRPFQMI